MDSISKMQTRNGESIELQNVDDYIFIKNSTVAEIRTKLKSIADLEHRKGDILICSYPKCGTNWTSGMVRRLTVRGVAEDQIDSYMGARIGLLELHPLERFQSLMSPRIIVTHLYPCRLPAYVKAGKAKIVLLLRNPKDVAVSYYYHLKLSQLINNKQDWDEFFDSYQSGIVPFGQYFDYLRAWEMELQNNKSLDIEIFHYEDFKMDGLENVRRMATHLGYKLDDEATLELEDKYQRTVNEIEALKDHLAVRKELSRKAHGLEDEMRSRMKDTEKELEEHKADQKAINADMTRQYKTMQTEMGLRIHNLETDLLRTRQQLAVTEAELKKTKEEKERITKEKDEEIESLNLKISGMEKDYERILDETLDSLISKIDAAKDKWEEKATLVQVNNKHILMEFGLNPLEL